MSIYKIKCTAETNIQGADGSDIIDLIDDYNLTEDEAKAEFEKYAEDGEFSEKIEEDLKEFTFQLIGFSYGWSPLEASA